MKLDQRMQQIQLILSDVDGVLTDGSITYDNQGIESKTFHVRDGLGIKLWQRAGHHFGIITARSSHVVKIRMTELGIETIRQGSENKLQVGLQLIEDFGLQPEQVCYVGDDLSDLNLLANVGLAVTVADGVAELKSIAHMTTKLKGGTGAMRELVEAILKSQKRWDELMQTYRTN